MQAIEEKFEAATRGPNRIIPGVVLATANQDTTWTKSFGAVSIEEGAADMKDDAVMWTASCTKLMTTVAVMQCVEKGLFTLDEDISRILPEWKSPDILTGFEEKTGEPILRKATKVVTPRQLMTHSSGMGYDMFNPQLMVLRKYQGREPATLSTDIANSFDTPLTFEPGEGWDYSCGLDWAGQMVERVTGSARLGDYMAENIWKPLGMTSTTFRPAERPDIAGQHCGITMRLPTGDLLANPPIPYPVKEPKDDLGGSGAYATAPDYLKLLSSLLKNDGKLLKPETVNEMFKPQLENPAYLMGILAIPEFTKYLAPGMPVGLKWNYGLGGIIAMEEISGRAGKGTMFWGGFPNLYWWMDRETGTCGIYASQLVPPGDEQSAELYGEFQKGVFQKETKV